MDAKVVLAFLVDEENQELVLEVYRGVSEEFASGLRGLKVGEGFNGQGAQTRKPLLVENASSDPRLTREVVKRVVTTADDVGGSGFEPLTSAMICKRFELLPGRGFV